MINTFSIQQMSKTGNLVSDLISRQYKLNLMADFLQIKFENPKLKRFEKTNQLGNSSLTLQRYKNDKKMVSPYRNLSKNTKKQTKKTSNTNFNNDSHCELDVKRPQMTSNDFKTTQTNTKSTRKNKDNLKSESIHENYDINDQYLGEILDNNDEKKDLAMRIISFDKSVRNDTIQDIKKLNDKSLATQVKKREQLVGMMPAI